MMPKEKKKISCSQSIEIAMLLFEENVNDTEITDMINISKLPFTHNMLPVIILEWKAFVHAAVVYGLMHHAPSIVAVEYIKNIQVTMKKHNILENEYTFVDNTFSAYMQCFVENKPKECPQIFIKKILNKNMDNCSTQTIQVISGVMALTISNILDKIELFEMMPD